MIYSVYNYDARAYDYYEGSGPRGTHAGTPKIPPPKSQLGASPDQAAWVLPRDARKVGSGDLPRGSIAAFAGADPTTDGPGVVQLGMYAVIAYVIWRALR